jgi:hypothetical protein
MNRVEKNLMIAGGGEHLTAWRDLVQHVTLEFITFMVAK